VIDVQDADIAILQVGKSAVEALNLGEVLLLFRPAGITTARMKALPDLRPADGRARTGRKEGRGGDRSSSTQSFNQPQADRPGHPQLSRRLRALPSGRHLRPRRQALAQLARPDSSPLLTRPRFITSTNSTSRGDGPNNKKLLDKVPPVFLRSRSMVRTRTFARITSPSPATTWPFTAEGADFDGKNTGPGDERAGRGFAQFTDGTSNTLLVGPVAPDRKIPWMKPVDVVIDDKFPDLGKKGGFPTLYKTGLGNAAPFLFCDGAVRGLIDTIDSKTFRARWTLDGGEVVGDYPFVNAAPMEGG